MKLTTFFISETKQNYAKTLTVPENSCYNFPTALTK